MRDIKIYGRDTDDGYAISSIVADEHSNDNVQNTVMQCLRHRSCMLSDFGYLILDSETQGMLDINRIM